LAVTIIPGKQGDTGLSSQQLVSNELIVTVEWVRVWGEEGCFQIVSRAGTGEI
jgi:hypothetical protein